MTGWSALAPALHFSNLKSFVLQSSIAPGPDPTRQLPYLPPPASRLNSGLTEIDELTTVPRLVVAHAAHVCAETPLTRRSPKGLGTVSRVLKYRSIAIVSGLLVAVGAWSALALGQSRRRGEYEVYPCRHKPAHDVEKLLADLLPTDSSVHLVVDEKSNSLLLRGPAEAQQIAKTLLQHVDRSEAAPGTDARPPAAVVKAYDVPAADLDHCVGCRAGDLRPTQRRADHVITGHAPDHRAGACRSCRRSLPGDWPKSRRASPASPETGVPAAPAPTAAHEAERVITLRTLDAAGMEQRLIALFGRRLRVTQRDGTAVYVLPRGLPAGPRILPGSSASHGRTRAARSRWSLSLRRWWTRWTRADNRAARPVRCMSNARRPPSSKRPWMRTAGASRRRCRPS